MNINWTVRFKNKTFWMAMIPAVILVIQAAAAVFGFTINLQSIGGKLIELVDAVFTVLVLLGVVVDHTTEGFSDSQLAQTYTEPKSDKNMGM